MYSITFCVNSFIYLCNLYLPWGGRYKCYAIPNIACTTFHYCRSTKTLLWVAPDFLYKSFKFHKVRLRIKRCVFLFSEASGTQPSNRTFPSTRGRKTGSLLSVPQRSTPPPPSSHYPCQETLAYVHVTFHIPEPLRFLEIRNHIKNPFALVTNMPRWSRGVVPWPSYGVKCSSLLWWPCSGLVRRGLSLYS